MDILEYAIQMEKDGENYYRSAAARIPDKGLSGILVMLADQEVKHRQVLEELKATGGGRMDEASIIPDMKNAFQALMERNETPSPSDSEVALYVKARQIEEEALRFYQEKAGQAVTPEARLLLERIAREEKTHYQILDSIVEFVSRPEPGKWLEDAEWYHNEEY